MHMPMHTWKYHSALDAYLKRIKKQSNSIIFTYRVQFNKVAKEKHDTILY